MLSLINISGQENSEPDSDLSKLLRRICSIFIHLTQHYYMIVLIYCNDLP